MARQAEVMVISGQRDLRWTIRAWGRGPHGAYMKGEDLSKPFVPVVYGELILEVAQRHGVDRSALLAAAGVPAKTLEDPNGRLSRLQAAGLVMQALKLSNEPALGYEIGLHSSLTSHGLMGYGLISSSTLRQAIELAAKFLQLRLPMFGMKLFTDGTYAVIEITEAVPLSPAIRQCLFDLFLVGMGRVAPTLTGYRMPDIELWFDCPEPAYYARYKARLPSVRFGMGANQLRFRATYLDHRPDTANPVTAKMVEEQCRRELEQLGFAGDLVGQVRAALRGPKRGYPDLEKAAALLHMSSRTLKRKLKEHGTSFHHLLEEARRAEGIRLLRTTSLTVEQIAVQLGYSDPSNFSRAFRKWTAATPNDFRVQEHLPGS
jgi:AraC-like DNA-binding protein